LTLRGKFALAEFDRTESSILGQEHSWILDVVESLHRTLQNLPQLQLLDLQDCHLPDEFLADILEALYPGSIQSLKLNGNMAHKESQHILCRILNDRNCSLRHLDLAWQRLPNARRNCSVLDIGVITDVLQDRNTSLRTLNLSENRLLDEDVEQLALVLSRHPNLRRVRLQDCRITDLGMIALANTLPKWSKNLTNVYLDGKQKINNAALVRKEIFNGLLRNVFIQELELPHCIHSKSAGWTLELNRAGRRALLEPEKRDIIDPAIECTIFNAPSFESQSGTDHICRKLWPRILERSDRIARQQYSREESAARQAASTVYFLLREKAFHTVLR